MASKDAMGCMLMENKPLICKLSPVGQFRGMETGNVSYRYVTPKKVVRDATRIKRYDCQTIFVILIFLLRNQADLYFIKC